MTRSRTRRINTITIGVVAFATLGCGGFLVASNWGAVEAQPTERGPSLTAAQSTYVEALRAIDPGLVANVDRAVRRAEETCSDIAGGLSGSALTDRVVERLSGGNAQINAKQADAAVTLMRQHIC